MVLPYYMSPPTFECKNNKGEWESCDEDTGAC